MHQAIKDCSREALVMLLEGHCGMQCYDTETDHVLRKALQEALKTGDIDADTIAGADGVLEEARRSITPMQRRALGL